NSFTDEQLRVFEGVVGALAGEGIHPKLLHAANSAGALWHPRSRYDMVRIGIVAYGLPPASTSPSSAVSPSTAAAAPGLSGDFRPALSFKAQVSYARDLAAGEGLSYGLHYRLAEPSTVATVPVGYADGVPRRLSRLGGQVLIGGRRHPMAGAVTMDQILVDCGPAGTAGVRAGDEVVLIGRQGGEEIAAWEWADRLATIAYEVTCGLSPRLPRVYA
ncbi:MAG TPA: alanine racemase, partial [Acidimicrobiales bacterium]|nr:alanine racemase [Acidimicrobiales bacterium]